MIAQLVKNPPATQETWVQFLVGEAPLEKGKATHSSILGIPWWLSWKRISLLCRRTGFDLWIGKIPRRRERLPTPVFWPGEFHGLCSPRDHKELDTTERLSDTQDYRVDGTLQARILECVAVPFSRGSSQARNRTQVFLIASGFFTS